MTNTLYLLKSDTGTITTPTLDLTGYANPSGTFNSILKASWSLLYCNGTLSNITVSHSQDQSTWSDLWVVDSLTDITEKVFYSFYPFIRITADYTAGTSTIDAGCRVQFNFDTYGLPNWSLVGACRNEDLQAIFPKRLDPDSNFQTTYPNQLRLAKTKIEGLLRGRGVDPNRLFTDGHNSTPTIPALRQPASFLVWWFINLDQAVSYNDAFKQEQDTLMQSFNDSFESALSGLIQYDTDNNGVPDADDRVIASVELYR